MGDFEEIFGAGADFDSIMYGINKSFEKATKEEEEDWFGTTSDEGLRIAEKQDEIEMWRSAMSGRGYIRGPTFVSYEELDRWDQSNKRPHVRRRSPAGYEVFFTDRNETDRNEHDAPAKKRSRCSSFTPLYREEDIPF